VERGRARQRARPRSVDSGGVDTISLARGFPSPDLLPLEELADCAETVVAREGRTILSYGTGAGYTPLRELIGEWFGVHPSRVVLTNGHLHGLALLCARMLPGRSALVEDPLYDRAERVMLGAGGALI